MVKTYGQTPAQLFRASHPLPIQNLGLTMPSNIPQVIEGIEGKKNTYMYDDQKYNYSFVKINRRVHIIYYITFFIRYKVGQLCWCTR